MSSSIVQVCNTCGSNYTRSNNGQKYCSAVCRPHRSGRRAKTTECLKCGTLTHNDKFCSRSCSAAVTNSASPRRARLRQQVPCQVCGTSTWNVKYCSTTCSNNVKAIRDKQNIERWLRGEINGVDKNGKALPWARKYIVHRANSSCEACGWKKPNPYSGFSILHIDHVDGVRSNGSYENLRLLCPNCHAMTPTYGSLNLKGL